MKSYFVLSCTAHALLLGALIVLGTLLSKPRMSYYAVDLFSAPAGGGAVTGPAVSPISAPAPSVPSAPKPISVPKVKASAPAPRAAEEELPDQDTLRMLAKLKKKRLGQIKSQPRAQPSAQESPSESSDSGGSSAPSPGRGGGGIPGSGSGIVGDAGPSFPYPWYMKAVADRLDKQWRPPQEYSENTLCWVNFVISRTGQISNAEIGKSSGDDLFNQLALRAVLNTNTLPPLPNGYPDATLNVHMKFVGRRM